MPSKLQIFGFGSVLREATSLDVSFSDLTKTEFQAALADSGDEIFLLLAGDRGLDPAGFAESLQTFAADKNSAMALFNPEIVGVGVTGLPPMLAALQENPAERIAAAIVRKSQIVDLPIPEESDFLWRACVELCRLERPVTVQTISGVKSESSPTYPALAPNMPPKARSWVLSCIQQLPLDVLVPSFQSRDDAIAVRAGLLQMHDFLDESHEDSQSVQGLGRHVAGDYWHGIMHRREPDYSNAKYWFRRVGKHPLFHPLKQRVDQRLSWIDEETASHAREMILTNNAWDPFGFIDYCQYCDNTGDPKATAFAESIQWIEMQLLLHQTYRDAIAD